MKNVRAFYEKTGACKYISHLDTNRVMIRAIVKSRLNIWRTEGFNQHPYITFALPLSLGFASTCESVDFRVLDDDEDLDAIPARLNACLPDGIRILSCSEEVHKPADIDSARYDIFIEPMQEDEISFKELSLKLDSFLALPAIIVAKKTKKGMKDVDLKPYILACEILSGDRVHFSLTLPAGSTLNINPTLLIGALAGYAGVELHADVTRIGIYTKEGEDFA